MAIIGFAGMSLMWICFSIHYPLAVLIGDLCHVIDTSLGSDSSNPFLDVLLECSDISIFDELQNLAHRALNRSLINACDAFEEFCAMQVAFLLYQTKGQQ
jgi:hypothetical protein